LLFLIYINDLPLGINKISTPILLADDTSVIISDPDPFILQERLTETFKILNIWFNANLLTRNFSITDYIKFTTTNYYDQEKHMWEPPTRQTDYSCLYQKVGDIYTPRLSRQYLYPTVHLNISRALTNQQCPLVSARPIVGGR
jgi:hypothetical protein